MGPGAAAGEDVAERRVVAAMGGARDGEGAVGGAGPAFFDVTQVALRVVPAAPPRSSTTTSWSRARLARRRPAAAGSDAAAAAVAAAVVADQRAAYVCRGGWCSTPTAWPAAIPRPVRQAVVGEWRLRRRRRRRAGRSRQPSSYSYSYMPSYSTAPPYGGPVAAAACRTMATAAGGRGGPAAAAAEVRQRPCTSTVHETLRRPPSTRAARSAASRRPAPSARQILDHDETLLSLAPDPVIGDARASLSADVATQQVALTIRGSSHEGRGRRHRAAQLVVHAGPTQGRVAPGRRRRRGDAGELDAGRATITPDFRSPEASAGFVAHASAVEHAGLEDQYTVSVPAGSPYSRFIAVPRQDDAHLAFRIEDATGGWSAWSHVDPERASSGGLLSDGRATGLRGDVAPVKAAAAGLPGPPPRHLGRRHGDEALRVRRERRQAAVAAAGAAPPPPPPPAPLTPPTRAARSVRAQRLGDPQRRLGAVWRY